jgi:hypothetical protein
MTEADWLTATDPRRMFDWLRRTGRADRHRLGLLFGECCDRIPPSVAEATGPEWPGAGWADDDDQIALTDAEFHLSGAVLEAMRIMPDGEPERLTLASVIRDIFGDPFRPPTEFPAGWRTDTAVSLARQIREGHDFGTMPILADAIQDAGCEDEHLLGHCRGPGPHVRGCWVLELVLGWE